MSLAIYEPRALCVKVADVCPVCGGRGSLATYRYNPRETKQEPSTFREVCPGCRGTGQVVDRVELTAAGRGVLRMSELPGRKGNHEGHEEKKEITANKALQPIRKRGER